MVYHVPTSKKRIENVTLYKLVASKPFLHFNRSSPNTQSIMPFTIKNSNGEILTGKMWRKDLSFFNRLPFYTNIANMDDLALSLRGALQEDVREGTFEALLVVR